MAQVIYALEAFDDLDRLDRFFAEDRTAAAQALSLVFEAVATLRHHPEIGRPLPSGLRELVISRGRTGYVALYRYDAKPDLVRVLRLRHQREAGYLR